jgi:hypothetical protein
LNDFNVAEHVLQVFRRQNWNTLNPSKAKGSSAQRQNKHKQNSEKEKEVPPVHLIELGEVSKTTPQFA